MLSFELLVMLASAKFWSFYCKTCTKNDCNSVVIAHFMLLTNGISRVGDADFSKVTAAMEMSSLSNYFRQVQTATEKVKLRCGLLSNYSCDDYATFVQLLWIDIDLERA